MTTKIEQLFRNGIIDIDDSFFLNHSIDVNAWALELQKCFFNENNSEIKEVNNDGIKIKTINGDFLLENSPETAKAYKAVFEEFSPLFKTGLFEIKNKKIQLKEICKIQLIKIRCKHKLNCIMVVKAAAHFALV